MAALVRVWHHRVFIPPVFHALVAFMEVYILLLPDRFFAVPLILVVPGVVPVFMLLAVMLWGMLPGFIMSVAALVIQVNEWVWFSPAAHKVLEMLWMTVLTTHVAHVVVVLFSISMAWMPRVVFFVMHWL